MLCFTGLDCETVGVWVDWMNSCWRHSCRLTCFQTACLWSVVNWLSGGVNLLSSVNYAVLCHPILAFAKLVGGRICPVTLLPNRWACDPLIAMFPFEWSGKYARAWPFCGITITSKEMPLAQEGNLTFCSFRHGPVITSDLLSFLVTFYSSCWT